MRLSPFHKHIAKLVAQGKPNREIKKEVRISDSRLSVLKRNPLMIREIENQSRLIDSKYEGALEELGKNATKVAKRLVKMVTEDTGTSDKVRAELGLNILSTIAEAEGFRKDNQQTSGTHESFEQTLRLTRTTNGKGEIDEETLQQAFIELEEENDAKEAEEDQIIELEPLEFVAQLGDGRPAVEESTQEAAQATAHDSIPLRQAEGDDEGKSPASEPSASFSNRISPELAEILSG